MKFYTDIHVPQGMNSYDFGGPLTFPLELLAVQFFANSEKGLHFHFQLKYLKN